MNISSSKETDTRPTAIVFNGLSFVGRALCEKLLNHQVEVICIDKFTKSQNKISKSLFSDPHFHSLKYSSHTNNFKRITRAHYIFHIIPPPITQSNQIYKKFNRLQSHTRVTNKLLSLASKHSAKFALVTIGFYDPSQPTSLQDSWGPVTQQKQHYTYRETVRVAKAQVAKAYTSQELDSRIINLLDVYGPEINLSDGTPISNLLYQLKTSQSLKLIDDGLINLYPTYIFDAVKGIIKAMFTAGTSGKVINIFSTQPVSQQSFAHQIRQQSSFKPTIEKEKDNLSQSFSRDKVNLDQLKSSHLLLKWQPKVQLNEGIGQTLQWLEHADIQIRNQPSTLPAPKIKASKLDPVLKLHKYASINKSKSGLPKQKSKSKSKKLFLSILVFISLIIVAPFISFIIISSYGFHKLNKTQEAIKTFNIQTAQEESSKAISAFEKSQQSLTYVNATLSPIGFSNLAFRLEKLINIGNGLAKTSLHLTQAGNHMLLATKIIVGSESGNAPQLLGLAQAEITNAYELLSLTSAILQESRPNLSNLKIAKIGERYQSLQSSLPQLRANINKARTALQVIPQIIGSDGTKKTYLVLLQNNAELRPTGGFIGSFALLTFQNSRLLDLLVEDVYTADGQLKGHVEPPAPINKYLGEATWFLRDVNWDPDFPTTARFAEWFLQKELSQNVDGTIAVNLYVAQDVLSALGSLHLSDYNEEINHLNLFSRAQYHSEVDFFPGSTQKKDFLSSLTQAMYLRFQKLEIDETIKLAQAINKSLESNQLQISLKDQKLAQVFSDLNWDGSLLTTQDCDLSSCLKDYLSINDANLGVNKANFFITRNIIYNLDIQKDGSALATTTIDYNNTSPAESWPAGTYKNYLRLFVPKKAKLNSVTINNKNISLDKVDIKHLKNHTSIGFLVSVPIKSQSQVKVKYTLPHKLIFERSDTQAQYQFLLQKQSGTGPDNINVNITYPSYLKAASLMPNLNLSAQAANLSTTLDQNKNITILFTK